MYLSRQKDSIGKAFHLNNPQPGSWSQLADFIRSLGYSIEYLAYQDWQVQLSHAVRSKENPLYHLLPFYNKKLPQEQLEPTKQYQQLIDPQLSCSATLIALNGSSIVCPHVNAQLLNTYFSYFIRSGWLDLAQK